MSTEGFSEILKNVAGIDIGSTHYYVSIDGERVDKFETHTLATLELVSYLKANGIKDVAMEATGVLWMPLFDMLEAAGMRPHLLNGMHARNVPAQKSDVQDCRWLRKVLAYGLVRDSFVPESTVRELRVYTREREGLVESAAESVLHIQKALELMNLKLHTVISDTMGASGERIIKAILGGERNPTRLAEMAETRIIKAKRAALIASLTGNYKPEYVFLLEQAYARYRFAQKQIAKCDKKIELHLKNMARRKPDPPDTPSKPARHNHPKIEGLHKLLVKAVGGANPTSLPGISDKTLLKLIAEVGTSLAPWPTEKQFISYIGLSPRKCQSGKMNRSKRRMPNKSRIGQIFRESAMSIAASKHLALKGFYNRIKARGGYKVAIKATARKLASLFYKYMTRGFAYVEEGIRKYEESYKRRALKTYEKKAREMGFEITFNPVNLMI